MPDADQPPIVEEVIEVAATPAELEEIHAALARFWLRTEATGERTPNAHERGEFVTAVAEIAANIIRHAYADQPNGRYRLRVLFFRGRVEARFYDWGGEYREAAPSAATDVTETDLDDLLEGGYGLPMARAMLDALEYDRNATNENQWRLVKHFAER